MQMWVRERYTDNDPRETVSDDKMADALANPQNGWTYKELEPGRIEAFTPSGRTSRIYVHEV